MSIVEAEPPKTSLLEVWGQNERMRHIPSLSWMIEKLDGDLRRRITKLLDAYARGGAHHPGHAPAEQALRALCKALDRLTDAARGQRGNNHAPSELGARILWAVDHAVGALRAIDASLFGRRYPFHTHERSKAEPVYGAFLGVISQLERVTELVRNIDPGIDESLLDGLVVLQEPLRQQPMA